MRSVTISAVDPRTCRRVDVYVGPVRSVVHSWRLLLEARAGHPKLVRWSIDLHPIPEGSPPQELPCSC